MRKCLTVDSKKRPVFEKLLSELHDSVSNIHKNVILTYEIFLKS